MASKILHPQGETNKERWARLTAGQKTAYMGYKTALLGQGVAPWAAGSLANVRFAPEDWDLYRATSEELNLCSLAIEQAQASEVLPTDLPEWPPRGPSNESPPEGVSSDGPQSTGGTEPAPKTDKEIIADLHRATTIDQGDPHSEWKWVHLNISVPWSMVEEAPSRSAITTLEWAKTDPGRAEFMKRSLASMAKLMESAGDQAFEDDARDHAALIERLLKVAVAFDGDFTFIDESVLNPEESAVEHEAQAGGRGEGDAETAEPDVPVLEGDPA